MTPTYIRITPLTNLAGIQPIDAFNDQTLPKPDQNIHIGAHAYMPSPLQKLLSCISATNHYLKSHVTKNQSKTIYHYAAPSEQAVHAFLLE